MVILGVAVAHVSPKRSSVTVRIIVTVLTLRLKTSKTAHAQMVSSPVKEVAVSRAYGSVMSSPTVLMEVTRKTAPYVSSLKQTRNLTDNNYNPPTVRKSTEYYTISPTLF